MTDLVIRAADTVSTEDIIDAIEAAFGKPLSTAWYQWKHLDGPWGRSWGCVAVDDAGVCGVRLLLPWRLRYGAETAVVYRAVEAATVPRAQGRRVFSKLNRELMDRTASLGRWSALFSTPNLLSRGGYKKLGWTMLLPVRHGYRAVSPLPLRRAELVQARIEDYEDRSADGPARVRTAWDAEALRWRFDDRSGQRYRTTALREADGANGLVYRVLRSRGLSVLLPMLAWGRDRERALLVATTARREGARAILEPVGAGAARRSGVLLRRGDSLIAIWENGHHDGRQWPVTDIRAWSLQMADLESVL